MRCVLLAQNPQRYHDDEESQDVADQTRRLELREEGRAPSVEGDGDEDHRPHDKRDLPGLEGEVGHRHIDAGLDLPRDGVAAAGEARKPAQRRHPAGRVRQDLLVAGGRELTHPVCGQSAPKHTGGDSAALRYCPPDVGAMEAISARLATTVE